MHTQTQAVLDFWFLPADAPGHGQQRREWFRKDPAFDAEIGARFGDLVGQALAGGPEGWSGAAAQQPLLALARILLLDQFTRNLYRDTARAFSGDMLALDLARELSASAAELALPPWQRAFIYMPFEHAEDINLQRRAVQLFQRLAGEAPETKGMLDYALRHQQVIERFGRFPHRNRLLGRASTPEEQAYLAQPGSGF